LCRVQTRILWTWNAQVATKSQQFSATCRQSFFVSDVPRCYVSQRVERRASLKVARSEESNIKAAVLWMVWLKCCRHRKCWTESINAEEHCILIKIIYHLIDTSNMFDWAYTLHSFSAVINEICFHALKRSLQNCSNQAMLCNVSNLRS